MQLLSRYVYIHVYTYLVASTLNYKYHALTIITLQFVIGQAVHVLKCMTTAAVQSTRSKINLILHI